MEIPQKEPVIVQLAADILITFRHVPGGRFRMGHRGAEENQELVTEVEVGEFWMGETPVTQEQYRVMAEACLAEFSDIDGYLCSDPSDFKAGENPAQRPVVRIDWHQARLVALWLMGKMRDAGILPNGYVVDLPPEALWEHACRAGTETEYWNGDGEAALAEVGWFGEDLEGGTHPVGELPANKWGLYDMHGNVSEWCLDVYDPKVYRKLINGGKAAAWSEVDAGEDVDFFLEEDRNEGRNKSRVLRGGSWKDGHWICRSATRFKSNPKSCRPHIGFRLCVFLGPCDASLEPKAETRADLEAAAQEGAWDGAKLQPRNGDEFY